MSLMKRYEEDMEWLTSRAARAAWEETAEERTEAFAEVIRDCEKSAEIYADPEMVRHILVSAVTKEFMSQRQTTDYSLAG